MKNFVLSKKSIIFAVVLVITTICIVACVATKVNVKHDKNGFEFQADSIQFNSVTN